MKLEFIIGRKTEYIVQKKKDKVPPDDLQMNRCEFSQSHQLLLMETKGIK